MDIKWILGPAVTAIVAILGLAVLWGRTRSEMDQHAKNIAVLQDQIERICADLHENYMTTRSHAITCEGKLGTFFREILLPQFDRLRDDMKEYHDKVLTEIKNERTS